MGHLFLVCAHEDRDGLLFDDVDQQRVVVGAQKAAHGDLAGQPPGAVDQVDVVGVLGVGPPGAQRGQRLADGHAPAEGQEFAGHQAAGGVFGVQQQRPQLGAILQMGEDVLLRFRFQFHQQVGRFVRLHLVDDADGVFAGQAGDDARGIFVFQLFQDVGRVLRVEMGQERGLVFVVQFVEQVGLVGGAQGLNGRDSAREIIHFERGANLAQDIFQVCVQHGTPPGFIASRRRNEGLPTRGRLFG